MKAKLPHSGFWLIAALVFVFWFSISGCRKPESDRIIEIWVSREDKPEIRVIAEGEYWSIGRDQKIFRASIGPKLLQNHTTLEGEFTWSEANPGHARFAFTLSNGQPVTVTILGVTPIKQETPEKDARRTIHYPPGKHSFDELMFVHYSYD